MTALPRFPGTRERARSLRSVVFAGSGAHGLLVVVVVFACVAVLRLASALLIPVAISLLLSVLFATPVRWLRGLGVSASVGAGVIVFGAVALIGTGAALLARPAAEWVARAPASLPDVEAKIRLLARPFTAIERTAEQVQRATTPAGGVPVQQVRVQPAGLMTRMSGSTANAIAAVLTVLFLTYFFASTEQLVMRKAMRLIPDRFGQGRFVHVLSEIERQMSRYLAVTTLISIGVGVATWAVLAVAALPNAPLWGAVAAVLNFIPYVGTVISLVLIGSAALLTFDGLQRTVIVVLAYSVIHIVSGYVVTPILLGRRLPLNQLALFIGLVFWTWVWGTAGALLAVPLTVMIKVVCDHVERLRPVALMLEN